MVVYNNIFSAKLVYNNAMHVLIVWQFWEFDVTTLIKFLGGIGIGFTWWGV
jgi:hypothetical protein